MSEIKKKEKNVLYTVQVKYWLESLCTLQIRLTMIKRQAPAIERQQHEATNTHDEASKHISHASELCAFDTMRTPYKDLHQCDTVTLQNNTLG